MSGLANPVFLAAVVPTTAGGCAMAASSGRPGKVAHPGGPWWLRVLTGPWLCCRPSQGVARIWKGSPSGSRIGLPGVLVAVLIGTILLRATA